MSKKIEFWCIFRKKQGKGKIAFVLIPVLKPVQKIQFGYSSAIKVVQK